MLNMFPYILGRSSSQTHELHHFSEAVFSNCQAVMLKSPMKTDDLGLPSPVVNMCVNLVNDRRENVDVLHKRRGKRMGMIYNPVNKYWIILGVSQMGIYPIYPIAGWFIRFYKGKSY